MDIKSKLIMQYDDNVFVLFKYVLVVYIFCKKGETAKTSNPLPFPVPPSPLGGIHGPQLAHGGVGGRDDHGGGRQTRRLTSK